MNIQLQHPVKKPIAVVFQFLTDVQQFVSVHPVIYRMEKTGENQYKVFERLTLGFIPYNFTYTATIENDSTQKTVSMKASVMKVIDIEMRFELSEEKEGTTVNETIHFASFLPIKSLMAKIFSTQHKALFANIEKTER